VKIDTEQQMKGKETERNYRENESIDSDTLPTSSVLYFTYYYEIRWLVRLGPQSILLLTEKSSSNLTHSLVYNRPNYMVLR
jgi:hypothetical protein